MHVAPVPPNENERLEYLRRLEVFDTIAEQSFDDVTRIAAHICDTPIALISLVDRDRQWFKSKVGIDAEETPRDVAFCSHAILQPDVFVVEDSLADERFHDNPLVIEPPHVRFYAGAPLQTEAGLGLGTLCVIDHEPRELTEIQLECLRGLGRQILRQFELRLVLNELRRIDELKNDFISTVNHELRTPLTSIRGSLSLVNSGSVGAPPTSQMAKLLDVAERNSLRLLSMVDDMLDLQKIEAGRMDLDRETVDLVELVGAAVEQNEQYVVKHECVLEWQPPGYAVTVSADRGKILQVIANLVSNAAKFSLAGGVVQVRLAVTEHVVRLSVVDEGRGIPDSAQASLFEKFSQVDGANTASGKGTGLGLAISKQLIELHGGSIGCTSREGVGSTFFFELPFAERPTATV